MTDGKRVVSKNVFVSIWLLCLVGTWCVLPYSYYLGLLPPVPLWTIAAISTMQSAILFGFACWLSFRILPKTDLHPFDPLHGRMMMAAVLCGVIVGFAIYVFDSILFNGAFSVTVHPPLWTRALASIYGAVNEEVLLRLFLFTLVYWVLNRFSRSQGRLTTLWITNLLVALLFGLAHLPAFFHIAQPTAFGVFRILVLNGIPGLVFGWLYWSRGLWSAMIAHFTTDLVIHVFLSV